MKSEEAVTKIPSQFECASHAYREIVKLAYAAASRSSFFKDAMQCVGSLFNSPFTAMYVGMASEIFDESCHRGGGSPDLWRNIVQECMNSTLEEGVGGHRFFKSRNPEEVSSVAVLSTIIYRSSGASIGSIVTVVPSKSQEHAVMQHQLLDSITNLISCCSDLSEVQLDKVNDKLEACRRLSQAAKYATREELAFALTNNLRNRTNCEQISFGHVSNGKVEILSISGLDELKRRSRNLLNIKGAMEECLDMGKQIIYQGAEGEQGHGGQLECLLHKKWHETVNYASVASIPLNGSDGCVTVLSLKRHASSPFTEKELEEIKALTEPYTLVFDVIEKANQGLYHHAVRAARHTLKAVTAPCDLVKKAMAAVLVAAICWFFFGTMDYNVTLSGKVLPKHMRHLATPLTGTLLNAEYKEGDQVAKGDILCQFDTEELNLLEKQKLIAELKIAQIEMLQAKSKGDYVNAEIGQANCDLVKANIEILDKMIDQATVKAPFDGVIVRGDLRKRIGEVIPQSEPLYEIAVAGQWMIEIEIPNHIAADMETGLQGKYIVNARPELSYEISLSSVSPGAVFNNNKNVYVAEADVLFDELWVKGGMEGVAKVNVGKRRICWVTLHKIIDYIYLNFWL